MKENLENKNGFPDPVRAKCFKCQEQYMLAKILLG